MRHLISFLSGILLVVLPSAPASAAPQQVSVTDLGTLGGSATFALDINNRSQVTGNSHNENGQLNAFVWERGQMTNLGFLPGGNGFSRGYAVNDRGVVVGESDNNRPRAFRWEHGEVTDIGSLPGGTTAVAHDVNNADRIVGGATNGAATRPFIADRGAAPVDLGTLAGTATFGTRRWSRRSG